MAVSALEQRHIPLIESQFVWQPWGPAGRYPLDDGYDEVAETPRIHLGSRHRLHSWGGYTTHTQRKRFQADSQQPPPGFLSDLRMDESSRADGGKLDVVGCADIVDRQYANPPSSKSGEDPVNHEGHALSPHTPINVQKMVLDDEEQISQEWNGQPPSSHDQGRSKLTCGTSVHHGDRTTAVYGSSSHLHENLCDSPDSDGDSPDSDDQWPQHFESRSGTSPPNEAQDFYDSIADQPSSPSDSGRGEPGCHGRSASKAKSSSGTAPMEITTLMVQNLPYTLSRDDLVEELDRCGYKDLFNFCHVPHTFATGKNQGVAFVNFLSPGIAERFAEQWHGNRTLLGMSPFGKALRVKVASMQGSEACERIARSRRMKRVKTGTFKPLIIGGQVPSAC